jgi:DNA-binding transcriptional LysR family regulator
MIEELNGTHWARRLKIKHLELFLALDDAGTLTQAAARLHMTQSAMSHWLAEMESVVGTSLVVRGRKLQLTPSGHLLKQLAINVLGDIQHTGKALSAVAAGHVPRLNIGSVWAGIAGGLPQAISAFQELHEDVAVSIHDGPFASLLEGLETRSMDAVIGVLDARAHRDGLEHKVLFEDRVAVVIGSGSRYWSQAAAPAFSELLRARWVMPPSGTLTRIQFEAFLLEQGASWLVPRAETASLAMMQALLLKGDYVGVCSESMADEMVRVGLFRKLPMESAIRFGPITVMWNSDHVNTTLKDFIACLRSACRQVQGQ